MPQVNRESPRAQVAAVSQRSADGGLGKQHRRAEVSTVATGAGAPVLLGVTTSSDPGPVGRRIQVRGFQLSTAPMAAASAAPSVSATAVATTRVQRRRRRGGSAAGGVLVRGRQHRLPAVSQEPLTDHSWPPAKDITMRIVASSSTALGQHSLRCEIDPWTLLVMFIGFLGHLNC
jgi:hypothetical protein